MLTKKENLMAGKKIDRSSFVHQAVKLIYEGKSDSAVSKLLRDRYNFAVSIPSVGAFRHNFYPKRLQESKEYSADFQKETTNRIQNFVDESLVQADRTRSHLDTLERELAHLRDKAKFANKYIPFVESAFEAFVNRYDTDQSAFGQTPEEQRLIKMKEALGEEWQVFASHITYHSATNASILRLICLLETKILSLRESLVKIYQDIFKGYKSLSMLQELTVIFERYNTIIIEEFFPDKKSLDVKKYQTVRRRILGLFDELKIRYQGLDFQETKKVSVEDPGTEVVEPAGLDAPLKEKTGEDLPFVPPETLAKMTVNKEKTAKDLPTDTETIREDTGIPEV
jgi:hypothetical protein